MDVGNPKQAAALGVIAIGALGYLGLRLVGPMFERTTKSLAVNERKASDTSTTTPPKFLPVSDPFSHPRLAVVVKTGDETSAPTTPNPGQIPYDPLKGDIRRGPYLPAPDAENMTGERSEKPQTEGEKPAPPPEETKTSIGLEAIVSASDPVAFLTVDGKSSEPFHLNQSISKEIRLEKIGDGSVVLKFPKGRLTLSVGEQKRL